MRALGRALAPVPLGGLALAAACGGTGLHADGGEGLAFPADCEHRQEPADELVLVPGRYSSGGGLSGKHVDLTASGRFELTAWACLGADTLVRGAWLQEGAHVHFSKSLGSEYHEPHDVVLTPDGRPAIHMRVGADHCHTLDLVVPEPPAEPVPPPPVPTDRPPPPVR